MIHPSYNELIEAINENTEENDNAMLINSRYSLVLATSKRARQLISGKEPLVPGAGGKKPLSIAIEELYKGKVKILEDTEAGEEEHFVAEALPADMFTEESEEIGDEDSEDEENYDEFDDEESEEDEDEETEE